MSGKRDLAILEEHYEHYTQEVQSALTTALDWIAKVQMVLKKNPFYLVDDRVKKFESTLKKCERKGYEINIQSIKDNVLDIGGIRIITIFEDEIFEVVNILRSIPGLNIFNEKDYVNSPKENGYSSFHIHARVKIDTPIDGNTWIAKSIPIEIQIRCKWMDDWASKEHVLVYKNENSVIDDDIKRYLKALADKSREQEQECIQLRDAIS